MAAIPITKLLSVTRCLWPLRIRQLSMVNKTMETCCTFFTHYCSISCSSLAFELLPLKVVRPFQSIFLLRSWYFSLKPLMPPLGIRYPPLHIYLTTRASPSPTWAGLRHAWTDLLWLPCCEIPSSCLGFRASTTPKCKSPQIYISQTLDRNNNRPEFGSKSFFWILGVLTKWILQKVMLCSDW